VIKYVKDVLKTKLFEDEERIIEVFIAEILT